MTDRLLRPKKGGAYGRTCAAPRLTEIANEARCFRLCDRFVPSGHICRRAAGSRHRPLRCAGNAVSTLAAHVEPGFTCGGGRRAQHAPGLSTMLLRLRVCASGGRNRSAALVYDTRWRRRVCSARPFRARLADKKDSSCARRLQPLPPNGSYQSWRTNPFSPSPASQRS